MRGRGTVGRRFGRKPERDKEEGGRRTKKDREEDRAESWEGGRKESREEC